MESHIADPLSLSQVAYVAGVTPRHLNRLFTETMGAPAMTYYRGLRLAVGRRLVHNSLMNMGDIAEATGFSNAGHFSNAYKAEFGVRPKFDRRRAPGSMPAQRPGQMSG
jgi:transcriptional regulator GlxA family with amidase domain